MIGAVPRLRGRFALSASWLRSRMLLMFGVGSVPRWMICWPCADRCTCRGTDRGATVLGGAAAVSWLAGTGVVLSPQQWCEHQQCCCERWNPKDPRFHQRAHRGGLAGVSTWRGAGAAVAAGRPAVGKRRTPRRWPTPPPRPHRGITSQGGGFIATMLVVGRQRFRARCGWWPRPARRGAVHPPCGGCGVVWRGLRLGVARSSFALGAFFAVE